MNYNVNLNDFPLPVIIKNDNQYYNSLCSVLDKYYNWLSSKSNIDSSVVNEVNINCEKIKEAIRKYYNVDIIGAQQNIRDVLEKYTSNAPFIVSDLNDSYAFRGMAPKTIRPKVYAGKVAHYDEMMSTDIGFYRARVSSKALTRSEMFHIPFDHREIISTQRFSIPGVPCLYLASTSFGAWLELGQPDRHTFWVSEFTLPGNLRTLNLCYQQHLINGKSAYIQDSDEFNDFIKSIEIFPLVIALSFKSFQENRKFKSEYIIPQLIMQVSKSVGIDAVAYLSNCTRDVYAYPQCVNLAILIPQDSFGEDSLWWERKCDVELTDPVLYSSFKADDFNSTKSLLINKGIRREIELPHQIRTPSVRTRQCVRL